MMIKVFENKRPKRVENQRKKLGIKKLKKLLNVGKKEITKWDEEGKLNFLLENLEIIEFYILLKNSSVDDEMIDEKEEYFPSDDFVNKNEGEMPIGYYIGFGILILLLVYVLMQFFIVQKEIRVRLSEPVSHWNNA